jgi:high-affinity iron transporter
VFQAFTILLREGVESFIVVAIIVTYLMKTGRGALLPAAWSGILTALLASVAGTWLLSRFGESPLQEGVVCLIAAALTGTMVVWMWKTGKNLRRDIENQLEEASRRHDRTPSFWAAVGVFTAAFVLIAREGAEAGLLLVSLVRTSDQQSALIGAGLGLALSIGLGALWIQNSRRMNLKAFFQVTGLFLLVFVAQLILSGVHELSEAGVIPYAEQIHVATEPWVEQGVVARWITAIMVLIPGGWLVYSSIRNAMVPAPSTTK